MWIKVVLFYNLYIYIYTGIVAVISLHSFDILSRRAFLSLMMCIGKLAIVSFSRRIIVLMEEFIYLYRLHFNVRMW